MARPDSRRDRGADATNVVPPSSSLVGRTAELEELTLRLHDARLVTVVGAPGVGKTRLAREVASARREERDGAWQIDLLGASDVAGICSAVEAALRVAASPRTTTPEARVAAVGKAIAARGSALFLFDAFEHLTSFAAQTIGVWRDAAPGARFLVTSRRPLRLAAERLLALAPLSPASAAELFFERARAQGATLGDDRDTQALVGDLVRRLDGLPLAIELAAARVRGLSLGALAGSLAQGIDVLSIGLADAPPRHASLTLAIDASWSLLTRPERRAAARLSLFEAEFSLESAEFLLDPDDATRGPLPVDVLGALTDASLVSAERRGDTATFRLLAAVRWFVRARLAEGGDRDAAIRRHAELVAGDALEWSAAGLDTPTPASAAGDLAAAFAGTLAAAPGASRTERLLAIALCLDDALLRAGRSVERTAYLDRAIDVATRERAEDARLAIALLRRARENLARGRGAEARVDRQRAAAIPAAQRDPRVRVALVSAAADEALRDGQLETARGLFEEAVATHKALGDRPAEARALLELSRIAFAEGSLERARAFVERARAIAAAVADPSLSAAAILGQANLTHEAGDDAADALFARALADAEASGDQATVAAATSALARLRIEQLRVDEARPLLERALALHRAAAHRRDETLARARLGLCDEIDGRLADAAAIYEDAIGAHAEAEDLAADGTARLWLARVEAARGETARAHGSLDEGRRRIHASGAAPLLPLCDLCEASVELAAARGWAGPALDACRDRARRAVEAATHPADGRALGADARIARALLARALGDAPTAAPPPGATSSPTNALVVSRSARWFRLPKSEAVSLSTSRSLRLILARLTDAREGEPGTALAPEALLAAGWPGERVLHDAGASRVYAAVAQLRRKGLRDVLLRRDDGYLLDPRVAVVRAEDADPSGA